MTKRLKILIVYIDVYFKEKLTMAKSAWGGLDKVSGIGFDRPTKEEVIHFGSPSIDWLFGSYGGLPRAFTAVLSGKPKSGKSILAWSAVADLHRRDPEARVLWIDTELRVGLQQGGATSKHVDMDRVLIRQTNVPSEIFDYIESSVSAAVQEGLKLPLIVLDSVSMIRGRRSLNADTIDTQQIGDRAATIGEGMSRILPVLRRNKIALLCTSHARAELDVAQQMLHKTWKMDAGYAFKHLTEFWVSVEQVESKAGKIFNEDMHDGRDNPLVSGHKLRLCMQESSAGGRLRATEVTLSYEHGFIEQGLEVATLAKNLGVVHCPEGSRSYVYKENKYNGFSSLCQALELNEALRNEIVEDCMQKTRTIE